MRVVPSQLAIDTSRLLTILSRSDNIKMFSVAVNDGLKIGLSTINKLNIPKKRYYRALKQLKDAGLIEKNNKKGSYTHTTFGSIVYQIILEMGQYSKHLEKMQMIDTIKHADKFSEAAISAITQEVIDSVKHSSSFISPSMAPFSQRTNNVDVILSFDRIIQILLDRIEYCKNEILISTRMCPEIIINKILEKSKQGVKVKVIADIELVKEYFKSQDKHVDNLDTENPIEERKCIVANPWYPDNTVSRRISDIPFGMIILDKSEVGIELVNSNNPKEFCGGIFIRDEKIAMIMTESYQQIWDKAAENIDVIK